MTLRTGFPVRYALADGSVAFALIVTFPIVDPENDRQPLDLRIVTSTGQNRVDNGVISFRVAGGAPYWFPSDCPDNP